MFFITDKSNKTYCVEFYVKSSDFNDMQNAINFRNVITEELLKNNIDNESIESKIIQSTILIQR